ncbi:MAG: hypothetical protein MUC88_25900 [Planctomycetes bacterium]|jgi:hypothetical protein|nr:hypothetical protein [Planctomycetota bacterium]
MDDLRRSTFAAVALSFTLVGLLLLFVVNAVKQPEAEVSRLMSLVAIFVLTYATIFQWIRSVKTYVDQALDRRPTAAEK